MGLVDRGKSWVTWMGLESILMAPGETTWPKEDTLSWKNLHLSVFKVKYADWTTCKINNLMFSECPAF